VGKNKGRTSNNQLPTANFQVLKRIWKLGVGSWLLDIQKKGFAWAA
jgi:hypothetical protein